MDEAKRKFGLPPNKDEIKRHLLEHGFVLCDLYQHYLARFMGNEEFASEQILQLSEEGIELERRLNATPPRF